MIANKDCTYSISTEDIKDTVVRFENKRVKKEAINVIEDIFNDLIMAASVSGRDILESSLYDLICKIEEI